MSPADLRSRVAVAALIACIVGAIACSILVLTGHEPPLSGLTVIGVPVLAGIAGWIARGPRWDTR